MILIDSSVGSRELLPLVKSHGVEAELNNLDSADACFEGKGPEGNIYVGLERKSLHDMLHCIDDSRYNEQRRRMKDQYDVSILIVEGHWKPHNENGMLMEGFHSGINWGYCRPGGRRLMYSKLRRYLFSVSLAGVIVVYTRDLGHTAFDIVEWFHYFQKSEHTSLMEMQKITIPTLTGKPSLTRKWAYAIEDVGTAISERAANYFKRPIKLATADEQAWLKIEGVSTKLAQKIVKQIW